MHDNPDKSTDIPGHQDKAAAHTLTDQIQDNEHFLKEADFAAAAADRLFFPTGREYYTAFDGQNNPFRHPLDGRSTFHFNQPLPPDYAHEIAQQAKPVLADGDARADFICRWRFWRQWASGNDERMAFLPADTRIPDHSIWHHLSITSAIQGCFGEATPEEVHEQSLVSILWFTIGPVQPLIAAARNIRDLWSGSYLLSYLVARACAVIAEELGPDHLISPSAWGQPLIDLHLRGIYDSGTAQLGTEPVSLWSEIIKADDASSRQRFLIPSLPNRIMALVPSDQAAELATQMAQSVQTLLAEIGQSVVSLIGDRAEVDQERFQSQLAQCLELQWHALPINPYPEAFDKEASAFLPKAVDESPTESLRATLEKLDAALGKNRPTYRDQSFRQWQTIYSYSTACLDAVKALRSFDAWNEASQWHYGKDAAKDSLTGKEEAVIETFSDEKTAEAFGSAVGQNQRLFKSGEILGALTLVKRLWHISWLQKDHGFKPVDFTMPNTHSLAQSAPYQNDADSAEGKEDKEAYYAVLVIDGDEMGKWLSGANMPPLRDQLAPNIRSFFEKSTIADLLNGTDGSSPLLRPLNPSFHLQFSEALGNFCQFAVRPIVEHFSGRLIYAGGDDVLALLPAAEALDCAAALRAAFRGQPRELTDIRTRFRTSDDEKSWNNIAHAERRLVFDPLNTHSGFLRLAPEESPPPGVPKHYFVVPGARADISAGIAVGHIKAPVQDLVRAAQAAEKRAKQQYGRSAVAVTLQKRSGEEVHWGSKWQTPMGSVGPFQFLQSLLNASTQPAKGFSYKVNAILTPYLSQSGPSNGIATKRPPDPEFATQLTNILTMEFDHCLGQDENLSKTGAREVREKLLHDFSSCLQSFRKDSDGHGKPEDPDVVVKELLSLFNVSAWMNRHKA